MTCETARAPHHAPGAPLHLSSPPPASPHLPGLCTLEVTLKDSRGALGRIAACLSSTSVLSLSYAVHDGSRATAEIHVPQAQAVRARNRLNRMVDVLSARCACPAACPAAPDPRAAAGNRVAVPVAGA